MQPDGQHVILHIGVLALVCGALSVEEAPALPGEFLHRSWYPAPLFPEVAVDVRIRHDVGRIAEDTAYHVAVPQGAARGLHPVGVELFCDVPEGSALHAVGVVHVLHGGHIGVRNEHGGLYPAEGGRDLVEPERRRTSEIQPLFAPGVVVVLYAHEDILALQLRENHDYPEHCAPYRRGGVEGLHRGRELNIVLPEQLHEVGEVVQRAAYSVQLVNNELCYRAALYVG